MILTTAEIAKDFTDTPVYLSASVQGSGHRQGNVVDGFYHDDFMSSNYSTMVDRLYSAAGMGPEDIDCGQFYENFTGQVLTSFEDHKFCEVGEGGPFCEGGRLEAKPVADSDAPHAGEFPINTSGGNLSEAYTHGFNLRGRGGASASRRLIQSGGRCADMHCRSGSSLCSDLDGDLSQLIHSVPASREGPAIPSVPALRRPARKSVGALLVRL